MDYQMNDQGQGGQRFRLMACCLGLVILSACGNNQHSDLLTDEIIKQKCKAAQLEDIGNLLTRFGGWTKLEGMDHRWYAKDELTDVSLEVGRPRLGELLDGSGLVNVPPGTMVHPVRMSVKVTLKQPVERQRNLPFHVFKYPIEAEGEVELQLYKDAYGDWQTKLVDFREIDKKITDQLALVW